jgi:alpha-N-acetylglucosaminidase
MKQPAITLLTVFMLLLGCTVPKTNTQLQPAQKVLARVIGQRASEITFKTIPDDPQNPGKMVFEIVAKGGNVEVFGNSGVAQCRGAYTYLSETCNIMISWGGKHVELPAKWPDLKHRRVVCPYQYTLQDNICVFGYTTPYFQLEDWLKYLDIMALHGYNMIQAPVGTEAIWRRVWTKYGFSAKELDDYFTGPAFFPWHRMGNVNKNSGPVPADFFPKSIELQKKILEHMRELGIYPIAPAFAGFVPKEFETRFPDAKVRPVEGWAGFRGDYSTHILHPMSPYYQKIGKDFIEEWKKEFGEADFFMADAFNELQPPVSKNSEEVIQQELSEFGNSIYTSMKIAAPDAKWVMMAWLFMDKNFWSVDRAKALLSKVPNDRMLILDLYAEANPFWSKFDNFFGKSWMFSIIPNWGGASQIGGLLTTYGTIIPEIAKRKDVGALKAFGYSPEGTENNEVIYELVSDAMWSSQAIDYRKWILDYCADRYGSDSEKLSEAWGLLCQSVYNKETGHQLNTLQSSPMNLSIPYNSVPSADKNVNKALDLFILDADHFKTNELFRNDLIELAVYKYMAITDSILRNVKKDIGLKPSSETDLEMKKIADLVNKIDLLLSGHTIFKLDNWITKARSWGNNDSQSNYYEADSKRIVTVWGADLSEYAPRLWNGLLSDYYLARWEKWYNATRKHEQFDSRSWELKWIDTPQNYRKEVNNSYLQIIKELEDISK